MKKILSLMLALFTLTSLLLTGCSNKESDDGVQDSGDMIKIAVAGPQTGNDSGYGKGFYYAAQLMADKWNEKGGVLGKQVEILVYDDKNSSDEAASIAQKIISEKGIVGVIGHFSSGVCMTAAPIYNESKMIEISPSASHKDYTSIGEYIFRNNTVIKVEARSALDIAVNDLGKKNIGLISIKTEWGTSTSEVVKELVDSEFKDATIVAHEEVVDNADDHSAAITKLHNAGADVVISVGQYDLLAPVANQYKKINPDIEIVGFSNSYSQELLDLGGQAVEGVWFPAIFFAESSDSEVKEYVQAYEKEYGMPPSALTSQAYDSVGMLLEAIEEAGTTESEKVKDVLSSITYKGVTGETKFDENREVMKDFLKIKVENGKFVLA